MKWRLVVSVGILLVLMEGEASDEADYGVADHAVATAHGGGDKQATSQPGERQLLDIIPESLAVELRRGVTSGVDDSASTPSMPPTAPEGSSGLVSTVALPTSAADKADSSARLDGMDLQASIERTAVQSESDDPQGAEATDPEHLTFDQWKDLLATDAQAVPAAQGDKIGKRGSITSFLPKPVPLSPLRPPPPLSSISLVGAAMAVVNIQRGALATVPHISQLPKLVNYAAHDCGAQVVSTSAAVKSASALLKASRDDYLMAPCDSDIVVVLELCDQILVQEVRLANFELFSSMVKTVVFSIAERAQPEAWMRVAEVHLEDRREIQRFPVEGVTAFAKYLRLEATGRHGHEFYCPIRWVNNACPKAAPEVLVPLSVQHCTWDSTLQVFGITMLEEFEHIQSPIQTRASDSLGAQGKANDQTAAPTVAPEPSASSHPQASSVKNNLGRIVANALNVGQMLWGELQEKNGKPPDEKGATPSHFTTLAPLHLRPATSCALDVWFLLGAHACLLGEAPALEQGNRTTQSSSATEPTTLATDSMQHVSEAAVATPDGFSRSTLLPSGASGDDEMTSLEVSNTVRWTAPSATVNMFNDGQALTPHVLADVRLDPPAREPSHSIPSTREEAVPASSMVTAKDLHEDSLKRSVASEESQFPAAPAVPTMHTTDATLPSEGTDLSANLTKVALASARLVPTSDPAPSASPLPPLPSQTMDSSLVTDASPEPSDLSVTAWSVGAEHLPAPAPTLPRPSSVSSASGSPVVSDSSQPLAVKPIKGSALAQLRAMIEAVERNLTLTNTYLNKLSQKTLNLENALHLNMTRMQNRTAALNSTLALHFEALLQHQRELDELLILLRTLAGVADGSLFVHWMWPCLVLVAVQIAVALALCHAWQQLRQTLATVVPTS